MSKLTIGAESFTLLRVPKWLSDEWKLKAPGVSVGKVQHDRKGNKMVLSVATPTAGKPKRFDIVDQSSEKLYVAQPERGLVKGDIKEKKFLRPNMDDDDYHGQLQQRVNATLNRTQRNPGLRPADKNDVVRWGLDRSFHQDKDGPMNKDGKRIAPGNDKTKEAILRIFQVKRAMGWREPWTLKEISKRTNIAEEALKMPLKLVADEKKEGNLMVWVLKPDLAANNKRQRTG